MLDEKTHRSPHYRELWNVNNYSTEPADRASGTLGAGLLLGLTEAEEINEKRIQQSKAAAGIAEEVNTWAGWKQKGFEVMHGAKALFGCSLI